MLRSRVVILPYIAPCRDARPNSGLGDCREGTQMQPVKGSPGAARPGVEIVRRTRAVQVMLSIPSARPFDRREVLEKARGLLAREQARRDDAHRGIPDVAPAREPSQSTLSRPGCGAWWAF